jgi:Ig-like domain from next to BRCA1 gene
MESVRTCESMEGIRFMNYAKRFLLGSTLLLAVLLNACASSRSTSPTDTLSVIYTSAAQTIEAQDAANLQSTVDQNTNATPTEAATLFPTDTPTLALALPTSTLYTTTLGVTGCDGAAYISDVTIPDNTVVEAGQAFVKTWMIQNTGSCTWDANYALTFVSGNEMDGTNTSIGSSVAPGQQAELSVTLTAPTLTGQYTGNWRLANDSGNLFGEIVDVLIDVTEDATATYEDTETPAYTATYTPTATPTTTPSRTPSPVPSKTPVPPTSDPTSTPLLTSTPTPKS